MVRKYSRRRAAKYINQKQLLPNHYTAKSLKQLEEAVRLVPKFSWHRYSKKQLDNFVKEVEPR